MNNTCKFGDKCFNSHDIKLDPKPWVPKPPKPVPVPMPIPEPRAEDIDEFGREVARIYSDLLKLEPFVRAKFRRALDVMFIIDCTKSMRPWIEACKEEINLII